jgi:hypothetical protein
MPAVAICGAVTLNVSFRALEMDRKKWMLLAALNGCMMRASFPFRGIRNSLSWVVFRKEKDHEFPRSSRLEIYKLNWYR